MPTHVSARAAFFVVVVATGCEDRDGGSMVAVPGLEGAVKSAAWVRANRRAFDGAPPVIPHEPFGAACTSCHSQQGMAVQGVGFAPPSPHAMTEGLAATSRCRQCHVFQTTDDVFAASGFEGLRQDLRRGQRLNAFAPPVIPHAIFMRENCSACHTGPAAREEIRCTHPERTNCRQCHVAAQTPQMFERSPATLAVSSSKPQSGR